MKIVSVVCLFLMMTAPTIFSNEIVKLAIGDWEPYTSETDSNSTLLEKIVSEAFRLEGVGVDYEYFPWKRSYILARDGQLDGTFPWAGTDAHRKDFYIHKISLIKDEGVYFHLKRTAFDWKVLEDLKKYAVGVTLGYKEEEIYKKNGIPAEAVPFEDLNFKKMYAGRIDVYQTSKIVGYHTIYRLFGPEKAALFTHHPRPAVENEFYILFSKKNPRGQAFADKFDSGLRKLKESGEYDTIIADYTKGLY